MNDFSTMSDTLDSLRNNFRLLEVLNHGPEGDQSPLWLMVYAKCAADIEWIIDSGQDMWTDEEQDYILGVHDELVSWGNDALEKS